MNRVTSADGTSIAYERTGAGPAVVLVGGGLDDGAENAPLMPGLAASFTVYNYARRGRAGSGDTKPYALDRELADLAALIGEAGGTAHLFGASSGGALALWAAASGLPVGRVAVYEVPYLTDAEQLARWRAYVEELGTLLAAGRDEEALAAFMRLAGSSEADIAAARAAPVWAALTRLAPTLAYDAACLGDGRPPGRLAAITRPTLVLTGDNPFFHDAATAIATLVPGAERAILADQGHVADPAVLAPALADFFARLPGSRP
jgi:pimeloyl-ACP methyl ester carboxylesterase